MGLLLLGNWVKAQCLAVGAYALVAKKPTLKIHLPTYINNGNVYK